MTDDPVRAEEPAPDSRRRLQDYLPAVISTIGGVGRAATGGSRWWLVAVGLMWLLIGGASLRRSRRPEPAPAWAGVDAGAVRRSADPELLAFADLVRIGGHELWPNLTLHPSQGKAVDLFPWSADPDDAAAVAVADAVLARAAAAGVDTVQRPMALWRPNRHEIDWDRAIVPRSRWSRRGGAADGAP